MSEQKPTTAPTRFVQMLKQAMDRQRFTLRQLADTAGLSPAYLSRLLNQERGLPADDTIARLEKVLKIEPKGALFDAAGRHDKEAAKFFQKNSARLLMRTLVPLNEEEIAELQKIAERFATKHKRAAE